MYITSSILKSQLDEQIADYDARRIHNRPYTSERDPSRFGKATAYGWSEDKFRQYSEVQRTDFGTFIREWGFKLD